MSNSFGNTTRRQFIRTVCALSSVLSLSPSLLLAKNKPAIKKPIPSSGEQLPVIGMGSSRTFDVNDGQAARSNITKVLQAFFDNSGALIDSSPMYGTSEQVIGDVLKSVNNKSSLFAATKVWTDGKRQGIEQMQRSMQRMGVKVFDLMQIHNLRDWEIHLDTLRSWKKEGKIRYIGITTSHGRFHEELETILENEVFDFVQFSYNIGNRTVEERLLPLAKERGIATLINRPFQRGDLFRKTKNESLPKWAADFDCNSWGQFFLKFVVSHPAVTCVIPATSKVHHVLDNMGAGFGSLPDSKTRQRMIKTFEAL